MVRPKKKSKTSSSSASAEEQEANVQQLSRTLGISEEQVRAMLAAQGAGLPTATASGRTSRRSTDAKQRGSAVKSAAPMPANNPWSDFMQDEMPSDKKKDEEAAAVATPPETKAEVNEKVDKTSASSSLGRKYVLPIQRLPDTVGILAQTGTLDSAIAGRDKLSSGHITDDNAHIHLSEPTILFPDSVFDGLMVKFVATSCSSCHSLAVDTNGVLYGWGRNEMNQLGDTAVLGKDVMIPCKLEGPWTEPIVAAATGKSHSVVIDESGMMYAIGSNKNGQCGVGQNVDKLLAWRKCGTTSDFMRKGDAAANRGKTKFVRVSCGENFTVALDDEGKLWTSGTAEYGCIGSGSTGEHFIQANKIAFDDCNRFELRNNFVTRDEKGNSIPLDDSFAIRLEYISCGKYHTLAIEATSEDGKQPRVFSWGSGNFGCLGHRIQADEYYPRMIESFNTALFTSNPPVQASCGSTCSMVRTKAGHVHYWGKHRSVGDATMYATIIDVLANNNHVVSDCSGGNATVVCTTEHGATVSYGTGAYGELGYGNNGPRSSSKPKFIDVLDNVIVNRVVAGYAHTLFILQNKDKEDEKHVSNLNKIEADQFMKNKSTKSKKGKK